jgi:hypothetical protein
MEFGMEFSMELGLEFDMHSGTTTYYNYWYLWYHRQCMGDMIMEGPWPASFMCPRLTV